MPIASKNSALSSSESNSAISSSARALTTITSHFHRLQNYELVVHTRCCLDPPLSETFAT